MWKWLDRFGEFALTNVRVVRDAWGAFAVWCVIATAACWYAADRVYDLRLFNVQSTASALNSRLATVEGDLRDARRALAERPTPTAQKAEPDPDSLYQLGTVTAGAPAGVVDRMTGMVQFPRVLGGPNFNVSADMNYRQFTLTGCSHGTFGRQSNGGFVTSQTFWDVTCRISGLRP